MITTDQALQIIHESVIPLGTETIRFSGSVKRVLAEDVLSNVSVPPFNRSSMDGYACRKVDLKRPLTVIEEIPAGKSPYKTIGAGQCAKIMTGAEVPVGADIVIMKENVLIINDRRIKFSGRRSVANISFKGSDLRSGDRLLSRGLIIRPDHLALFASVGKLKVSVYRSPSIAVIITGSEIVEPELIPGAGQIRNSNGPQLVGQLKSIALEADDLGIVLDIREEIKEKIICAIEDHDLVIISGGISVGDYDYVPGILDELGFRFLFSRISSKPGRHTILANKGNCYIFCLPGNPVSSFVQFEVLGKSLIYKLMGADFKPVKFSVKLSDDYMRQYSDCSEIIPVRINREGEAELLPYHGSSHIHALAYASALMEIPLGTSKINQGDTVYVRPL